MSKKQIRTVGIFSAIFYIAAIALMIVGTINDLAIDKALFDPNNKIAIGFEAFGQFVYWGMWGPIFSVLFLTRHSFNECLEIIGRLIPFIKPIKEGKLSSFLNTLTKLIWGIAFFVLAIVGYKKLIENVLNDFVSLPQLAYFAICAVVSVISILLFSKVDKKTLNKLEGIALAGVLLGICYKVVEECKTITHRIRFREMVAYSNGIMHEDGDKLQSFGELENLKSHLSRDMVENTDFSPFTKWYQKGEALDYYDHRNSFPSGHTTYSCAIFLLAILCTAFDKLKKLAPFALLISFCYVGAMGYYRMVAGAHYLTDVTSAAIIGYTLFLLVFGIYSLFNKKGILPTRKD